MKTRRISHPLFLLALMLVAGGTFTSCVKQKNCKTTKRTFCVEGELHYVSNEEAFIIGSILLDNVVYEDIWEVEPSDIPQKYHRDGIMVRVSLLHKGISHPDADLSDWPYQVKCIESLE
ncbi:MAG: hypothetical protein J5642_07520 [Bacteroidales bacterium]|nr:hypothetical protein [Bacteroidales bacterium]